MEKKCENCLFAEKMKNTAEYFECRKNAPTASLQNADQPEISYYPTWPVVSHYDWCGEFQPRRKN